MSVYLPYHCIRCDYHFEAKTNGDYAPACLKCKDSEYINNGYRMSDQLNLSDTLAETTKTEEPPKDEEEEAAATTEEGFFPWHF